MYLDRLELLNFRNYEKTTFSFSPHLNIIIAGNAQGKTNILEAIYFLSAGGSHRQASDFQLIRKDASLAGIKSSLMQQGRKLSLEVFLSSAGRKRIKVNGVERFRGSDLLGNLHAVIFSPEDLKIVKGGPQERRAFLDDTIVQTNPGYYHWRRSYDRILRQRNLLLKTISSPNFGGAGLSLETWDENLIDTGSILIEKRIGIVKTLRELVGEIHGKITEGKETLEINYLSKVVTAGLEVVSKETIKERFKKELERRRHDELERKVTLVGPHRDDLMLLVNGDDARFFSSQGQQRTVALALKLGQFKLIEAHVKDKPLLLLDDVMSELDEARRRDLMEMVRDGTQVLITSTIEDIFGAGDQTTHKVIRIKNGSLADEG
jgi:DNA replication and repair protein RecF